MADQDLHELVRDAAARPGGDVPLDAITARARERRRRRRAVQVLASLVLVAGGVGLTAALVDQGTDVEFAPADDTGEPAPPAPDDLPGPDPDAEAEPAPEGPTEPDPEPEVTGPEPAGPFGTDTVASEGFPLAGGEYATLTDVRVASHPGFDRVVLEFDAPAPPGFRVGYVQPPIVQDGSGNEMAVAGTAFLELRLHPASGYDATAEEWTPTYTGPDRVTGSTSIVTEVVRTGDFEAMLAWTIGLDHEAPFAVTWLSDPVRLVVDLQVPDADSSGPG